MAAGGIMDITIKTASLPDGRVIMTGLDLGVGGDPKPGHSASLEDRLKALEAKVLDLQAGMGGLEAEQSAQSQVMVEAGRLNRGGETELAEALSSVGHSMEAGGFTAMLDPKPVQPADPYSPKIIWRRRIGDVPARDPIDVDVQDGRAECVLSGPYHLSEGASIEVRGGKVLFRSGKHRPS